MSILLHICIARIGDTIVRRPFGQKLRPYFKMMPLTGNRR
jgi:hypothetical protein